MTRFKSLLAAAAATAIVAVVPASAQLNVHFVGAGSSAQFTMAAIATDQAAINLNTANGGGETVQHWTFKNGVSVNDNRDSRILGELGNIALVWLESSGTVTDIWATVSVDSTVGVRTFSAQETSGSGAQIQINQASGTAGGGLISPQILWPDNNADVALSSSALAAVNTSVTGGVHVNVGLTDIRPEDALFATTRAYTALNTTTYKGLGYVGPTKYIGAPIYTDQGTGTVATPIGFALSGKEDPISKIDVPAYTTIPIGAAPIVFIMNNGGTYGVHDLISGVVPDETGGPYYLSTFFGGTRACDTDDYAFGGNGDGAGTPLTVLLREPLSGTMNTTEFSLFRSTKNPDGSQETGVINPTRSPYNPLALSCPTHGQRQRAIGTGEVVNAVKADANSIGYIFYGFANAAKLTGSSYNYLTVDGVDPLALPGTTNQELPNCTGTTCPSSLWTGSESYPNLRNGTYKAWSIYRWLVYNTDTDAYGPTAVAQIAQDYVDSDIADFVPFLTSTGSDGLSVYRSHFTQSAITGNNGSATAANSLNNGNTLGGGSEAGGDEGGYIEGPFGITGPYTGYVEWHNATEVHDDATVAEVQWKLGAEFQAGAGWVGCTIGLGNPNSPTYTQTIQGCPEKGVNKCNPTTTILYVGAKNPASSETIDVPYTVSCTNKTYPAATTPGVLSKHQ
jgi:ABC-type phosphate transport system substrate-binding protein